jgi:uncharacterized protein (TIGR00369 family)
MLLSVMAIMADVLGGGLAIRTFYPDWAATVYLRVRSEVRVQSGYIYAHAKLRTTASNTVLVKVDFRQKSREEGKNDLVATSHIGYKRIALKDPPLLQIDPVASDMLYYKPTNSAPAQPFLQKVGLTVLNEAQGTVQAVMSDYVRNSFNVLQGGVFALLADVAGQTAARRATGKAYVTNDLAIRFLNPGKTGPFQTRLAILRQSEETFLSRIKIIDMGEEDRIKGIAKNFATPDHSKSSPCS